MKNLYRRKELVYKATVSKLLQNCTTSDLEQKLISYLTLLYIRTYTMLVQKYMNRVSHENDC